MRLIHGRLRYAQKCPEIWVCNLEQTLTATTLCNYRYSVVEIACPDAVLSISFEVDVSTGKVGMSFLGGLGACPPENFEI